MAITFLSTLSTLSTTLCLLLPSCASLVRSSSLKSDRSEEEANSTGTGVTPEEEEEDGEEEPPPPPDCCLNYIFYK